MNTLGYAPILEKLIDQATKQGATSSWMENNAGQIQYTGGKEIKIPVRNLDGLGDYGRTDGSVDGMYPTGNINLEWITYTLEQDRGKQFRLDRMDNDESAFNLAMEDITVQFAKNHVIPELDAYRYSKIATQSGLDGTSTTENLTADTVIKAILRDINAIGNEIGDTNGLIIPVSWDVYTLLQEAKYNKGSASLLASGDLNVKYDTIAGIPYYPVSNSRMHALYLFNPNAGFTPVGETKINYLVLAKTLPIAIKKVNNIKIFSPDVNQNGDDWKLQLRVYHDLILPKNASKQKVRVSVTSV